MAESSYLRRSLVRAPPEEVAAWHRRDGALRRLVPPWTGTEVVSAPAGLRPGDRVELRLRLGPVPLRWISEIRELEGDRGFRDVQLRGPFARWVHDHRIGEPDAGDAAGARDGAEAGDGAGAGGGDVLAAMEDAVRFELPLGRLGRLAGERRVLERLEREFAYRHRTLDADLAAHRRHGPAPEAGADDDPGGGRLHVAVTGSTGLVGSTLVAFLRTGGHRVSRLVRGEPEGPDEIRWVPDEGLPRPGKMAGVDAVVHLAGEPIVGRWTRAKRRRIEESRVGATRRLCRDLAALPSPPPVFVSASGVHYYGDRGEERLTEESGPGEGFLARVCRGWEEASRPLEEAGARVTRLRFGVVLSPAGGALAAMLPAFRAGVGGPLGDGRQFMPWISLDDLLDVILHALTDPELSGAVNAVAPRVVRNREFTATLGRVLRRPTALRVPETVLRAAGGRMAEEMLLGSLRVEPEALRRAGHRFRHPELEGALRHLLGRTASRRIGRIL